MLWFAAAALLMAALEGGLGMGGVRTSRPW
jgi:hypothetical protein